MSFKTRDLYRCSFLVCLSVNLLLLTGGVLLAYESREYVDQYWSDLPDYITSQAETFRQYFDEALLWIGVIISVFAVWGVVGFVFRMKCMIIIYQLIIFAALVLFVPIATLLLMFRETQEFPIQNQAIRDEFKAVLDEHYCTWLPLELNLITDNIDSDAYLPELVAGLNLLVQSGETVPCKQPNGDIIDWAEGSNIDPVTCVEGRLASEFADTELADYVNESALEQYMTFVKPLVDLGLTGCEPVKTIDGEEVSIFFSETVEECQKNFQDPCMEGIIIFLAENVGWVGLFFLAIAVVQLVIFCFGIRFYLRISRAKFNKRLQEKYGYDDPDGTAKEMHENSR